MGTWTWLKMAGRKLEKLEKLEKLDFLQVLNATLGSENMCLQAWFILHGPAVFGFVVLPFWAGWARLG